MASERVSEAKDVKVIRSVKHFFLAVSGRSGQFSLESRIFNSICMLIIAAIAFNIVFNHYIHLYEATYLSAVMLLLFSGAYYLSRIKRKLNQALLLGGVLIHVILCVIYFFNAGISGPFSLLFVVTFFLLVTVAPVKQYFSWLVFNLLTAISVMAVEYVYPQVVRRTYVASLDQFLDIGSTYIVTVLAIFIGTRYIRRSYAKEKQSAYEQRKKLEHLHKEKDKLFSIISHDLRAPLANVRSYLELLTHMNPEPGDKVKITGELLHITQHTQEMLDNLLSWSKAQMNGAKANLSRINVYEALTPALEVHKKLAEKKEISIDYFINNDIYVLADTDMLQLVIRNLVNNAIKFSTRGGRIAICTISRDNKCVISVKDGGKGIAEDRRETIFSLNADSTFGTENEKGVGLGLVLCKEYTQMQDGEIWFESTEGEGTTFFVALNCHTDETP